MRTRGHFLPLRHGVLALTFACAACSTGSGAQDATGRASDIGADRSGHDGNVREFGEPSDGGVVDADLACAEPDGSVLGAPASLDELKASVLELDSAWRFATDPTNVGQGLGWEDFAFDDSTWGVLDAGQTWEEQGVDYDGVAWYRKRVFVPASWSGSAVRFEASGVDDEYDLYVNGQHVKHFGERPDRSVWNWRTKAAVGPLLRYGAENVIALRVIDWGGGGGLWRSVTLRRALSLDAYRHYLPSPVVDEHPEWVTLYWEAWRMAWEKVAFGNARNQLAAAYMDEGFNEQIYQWDSCFITLFARYGLRLFPVMATLDNFYARQRADGYIQRVYSETTGQEIGEPSVGEPLVNPPLFAWVEWAYLRFSGDASRVARVLPQLERYFGWLENNLRATAGQGLYYQTDLGSGMDNTPRGDVAQSAWADMSAQQALAALCMARLAEAVGDAARKTRWEAKHAELSARINELLYDDADGFYYDLTRSGAHAGVRHVGAFWPLIAQVADSRRAAALVRVLEDPLHFKRPHRYPALSAADPAYDGDGHYWRGGVWAPTNYMVVKGLDAQGYRDLAREVVSEHLEHLAAVYAMPTVDEARVAPEERDGSYQTLWECYAAEQSQPGTRWDGTYYSRQDFVGWTGLGPIALLIEDVLGFEVFGGEGRVVWHLTRTDRHGVERLAVGDNLVNLVAEARPSSDAPARLLVRTARRLVLQVERPGTAARRFTLCAGDHALEL